MDEFFSRSEALLGEKTMEALRTKRVILFGVGGVGSWCAEALVRTGLSHLTIVDGDTVQASNLNRQLPATRETMGMPKVEALKARLLAINPEADIVTIPEFYHADNENINFQLSTFNFIIDAIDSVNDKTDLIINATRARVKIFSSMGAALRFDPTQVRVAEFWDVKGDALARALRERMKKLGVKPYKKVRCVYSLEQAVRMQDADRSADRTQTENHIPVKGSLMQVTAVFGCTLASQVIEDIRKNS